MGMRERSGDVLGRGWEEKSGNVKTKEDGLRRVDLFTDPLFTLNLFTRPA